MGQSNKGEYGVESVRVGGRRVDELPICEGAVTKIQMPDIHESARENEISQIKGKYPKQSVAWINGAIRECEATIKNVRRLIGEQRTMIDEYTGHITLCRHRDKELMKLHDVDHADEIKALKKRFPLYNVKAMRDQVQQCNEALHRADGVIDAEHKSIAELRALLVVCEARDRELKAVGE